MEYTIIVDSCADLTEEMKQDERIQSVPLELHVDGKIIVDDDSFKQAEFIRMVKNSEECPSSACPSPDLYKQAYACGAKRVYVVTLSDQLSGSYNSARLGKQLFEEENPDSEVQIHVFNSRSAASGETLLAHKIQSMEEEGMSFASIVERVETFIKKQNTFFVLETLDTLRKNGRLTGLKAVLAMALNIKPVMGATEEGSICQLDQARGMERAVHKMMEYIAREARKTGHRVLAISHCNCPNRAAKVKEKMKELGIFDEILVMNTAGVSTMYANDGGIVISF